MEVTIIAKAVRDALHIPWIAEKFNNLFSYLRWLEDRAITLQDKFLDADTL